MEQKPSQHEAQQEKGNPMVDHMLKERRPAVRKPRTDNKGGAAKPAQVKDNNAVDTALGSGNPPHLNDEVAELLVQNFKLLADETRLRILFFLMHRKELNVRSLCELLDQSQPAVSHHLALLRNAELISSRRDGKHNFYHLMPGTFQRLIDTLATASPGTASDVQFDEYVRIPGDG